MTFIVHIFSPEVMNLTREMGGGGGGQFVVLILKSAII